jgi:asparagine synthase (glutamine-hydrolysing)
MPGIVGLVTRMPRPRAEAALKRMVEALHHESCYRTGTWVDEPRGIYVGWAARKNSFADGMPLCDARGGVVLVFSGEEYEEPSTSRRVNAQEPAWAVQGPSYLARVAAEDPTFPLGLNGRFHGLLVDHARDVASLFNDRYGIHRLYYHESKDAFYFAAEAKAILEVCPELRTADPRGLGELVACGCVLENRTVFRDVHLLPPASSWVFRNGAIERKSTYFQPREWEEQTVLEAESYYQELREVFSRCLPRYFGGNERIGMSLTGGLDTRMIMAWHKSPAGSLPCYSFGGMFRDCQDVRVARQVARACGQPHEVIEVGKDFLGRFPQYAERAVYLTDGCASVSHAADLFANERAAQIAPVRMTGNYGGEVLRRVRAFKAVEPAAGLFRPELLNCVRAAKDTYTDSLKGHPLSFALFRQTPWHHYGLLALEQTQVSLRSPYLDNDLVRTVFRAPASVLGTNDVCLNLIGEGNPTLRRIRTDRGLGGDRGRVLSAISREFLEFTFKAEYAYDYGMPQGVAAVDHLFAPLHLERLFAGRHKFKHYRVWYRDALSGYVKEMLLDRRTLCRPYLQGKTLEGMVQGHLKGNRNYTSEIHQVLTLELIHRLFLDSK